MKESITSSILIRHGVVIFLIKEISPPIQEKKVLITHPPYQNIISLQRTPFKKANIISKENGIFD